MRRVVSSAPGKIILLGEHAVVYGQPALAVPVQSVRATAEMCEADAGTGLEIHAADLNERFFLKHAPPNAPLGIVTRFVIDKLTLAEPDARLTIRSTIPVAGGMGSGAAVSAAAAQALAAWLGTPLPPADLSALVYEGEKIHHGTPSGIDNTVICFAMPVYFVKGKPPEIFAPKRPFDLLIADTGVRSPTKASVIAVRELWQSDPARYEDIFDHIGQLACDAKKTLEAGDWDRLGVLMNRNQELLRLLGVSSPELEKLIEAALHAGANGAKLSGGGRGGNMIALVARDQVERVRGALIGVGATRVLHSIVE